jgi:hypothetical protein
VSSPNLITRSWELIFRYAACLCVQRTAEPDLAVGADQGLPPPLRLRHHGRLVLLGEALMMMMMMMMMMTMTMMMMMQRQQVG